MMLEKTIDNRYRVTQRIAEDSLSLSYQAFDSKSGRPVSIRFFKSEIQKRPQEILFRFRKEIHELINIDSENIMKVFETGEFEGADYIVSEYVEAVPLSDYFTSPLATNQAIDLILQVATGLSAAHQKGLIHRTVKPSSIIIPVKENQVVAKLADFATGLLLDLTLIETQQDVIQIFGYMSPEATGILRKPIDERSDIYSLGIIFYQLLTGKLPYEGTDVSTLIHQHIARQPKPPQSINPDIPEIISEIVLRMIAKDPLERYQVIFGVIADLEEYKHQAAEGKTFVRFELGRSDRVRTLTYGTRLIGRDKELETLKDFLKDALQSQGRLCFVSGEAGVGKSRLIDELREYTYSIGGIFVAGKCSQYEFKAPYKVITEIIEAYIKAAQSFSKKDQEELRARLKGAIGGLGGEVAKITSKVTQLLGDLPALAALDPEKEKIRFLITVAVFILHLSTRQKPVVIFLDDLQWADDGTIELLEKIAGELSGYALVIIASYRPAEMNSFHPLQQVLERLRQKNSPFAEIDLKPLELKDSVRIISRLLLREEKEIFSLAKEVDKVAKGNPFCIFELLRTLVVEGVIFWKETYYDFDMYRLQSIVVPENIVEIVLKRIKYIPQEELLVM
ncbi:MAG: AAA family ATPase, partial [Candidatus Omnitrophica bacterium]|nr:AAA family ATPase [Candidatus Omnitrophota bacterium]